MINENKELLKVSPTINIGIQKAYQIFEQIKSNIDVVVTRV